MYMYMLHDISMFPSTRVRYIYVVHTQNTNSDLLDLRVLCDGIIIIIKFYCMYNI